MHAIIRQSLLASIQTMRSILLGMEAVLRTASSDQTEIRTKNATHYPNDENELTLEDEKKLAQVIGLKFEDELK